MKRLTVILSVFALLATLVVVATPWMLSSDVVKQQIADRIEQLTGLKTTLKGTPRLSLIPFLGIKLNDVVIANPPWMDPLYQDQPLVSMEALKGRLKLLPAIFGRPELVDFKLIRPRFNLRVSRDGKANWRSKSGAFAQLLATTKNPESSDSKHARSALPLPLGNFTIVNGTIDYQNDQTAQVKKMTSVNVKLSWPDTSASLKLAGSMILSGELVEINSSIASPVELLAGGVSKIEVEIESNPMNATFEGKADFGIRPQFSGTTVLSSPSVRELLSWTGYDLTPGSTPGELELRSKLVMTPNNFELRDATVSIDGNTGTGFLDISVSENNRLGISGTLAFDNLNLDPYLQALDTAGDNGQPTAGIAKLGLVEDFDLDLRISAKSTTLGDYSITSMAATAQIRDGNIIIDVGEATLFGGMIQTQMQVKLDSDGVPVGEIKLNFIDVELDVLSQLASPTGIKINGKGTATILLKFRGSTLPEMLRRLNGFAKLTAFDGQIEGLDIAEIARQNAKALDSSKVLAKATRFNRLTVNMYFANGIAFISDTRLEGDKLIADIGGKADLSLRSVAMNGRVMLLKSTSTNADDKDNITHDIPFFVGGTIDAPFFAPDFFSKRRKSDWQIPVDNWTAGGPPFFARWPRNAPKEAN